MATARSRTSADIRRDLETSETRLNALIDRWRSQATTAHLGTDRPEREFLDMVEALLRTQRGTLDHLHQLWIELAQTSGYHAPQ